MQSLAVHGYCTSLPALVDLVRMHIGIRSVIAFGRQPGQPNIWVEADNNATPEVLMNILTEDMDLADALIRVESWVVLGE
jgi:hypothetical protein